MKIVDTPMELNKKEKPSIVDLMFLVYFVITPFYYNSALLKIGFLTLMGITIIKLLMVKNDKKIIVSPYCFILLNFAAYNYISKMWAWNLYLVDLQIVLLVAGVGTCFIMTNYFVKRGSVNTILYTIVLGGIASSIYTIIVYGGLSEFYNAATEEMARLGGEVGNENIIGMLAADSVIMLLYYAIYKNKKICYLLLLPPAMVMAASGSRKALLVFVIGIVLLIYFKQKMNRGITKIFRMIFWGIIIFIGLRLVLSLEIFNTVTTRMEMLFEILSGGNVGDATSTDTRKQMIEVGLQQFWKNPLVGVGLYNTALVSLYSLGSVGYLHNDYVELLVNGGIVGFVLYYSVLATLLLKHIKLMKVFKDPELIISFIMLVLFLITNVARVTYYGDLTTYLYMTLWISIVEIYKRRKVKDAIDKEDIQ